MKIRGLDTETTGIDIEHGCGAFLVTISSEDVEPDWWEWRVNPLTREALVQEDHLEEIQEHINEASELVLQNTAFDYRVLMRLYGGKLDWDWSKVRDTVFAAHLLDSNKPKTLEILSIRELDIDISKYNSDLKKYCLEARRVCKSKYPDWRVAKKGLPELPSAKDVVWKNDLWLLREIAFAENYPSDHPYWTATSKYANTDSEATLHVWFSQEEQLKERDLWDIYLKRLEVLPIIYRIQKRGVSLSSKRLQQLVTTYEEESTKAGEKCFLIAKDYGYDLELPKSGNNKSLTQFVFEELELPVVAKSKKTGAPSLDKSVIDYYLANLKEASNGYRFIENLRNKRKRDTALNYLEGYQNFWVPVQVDRNGVGWYKLHPSLNPTGTDTLRWSSQNPNQQNISKQEGFNLRYAFGPFPGREWWSLDANNIELRLPAYESGEEEMIALFERPDDPPFYGSNHLLIFSILHPDKWKKYGADVKKEFASTWYQWTKNGNFAVQYGAVEASGTADRAYKVKGAQRKIQSRFKKIAKLNQVMIDFADQHGYIETMPDKTVNPNRGYPLLCTRSKWGNILPTVPLNYHIQGTAMWWMMKAMIRVQKYLDYLNDGLEPNTLHRKGYFMIMQVHDELVFDFPAKKNKGNLPKIRKIQKLMEQSGDDIGVPTPVGIDYHPNNWSESE